MGKESNEFREIYYSEKCEHIVRYVNTNESLDCRIEIVKNKLYNTEHLILFFENDDKDFAFHIESLDVLKDMIKRAYDFNLLTRNYEKEIS